MLVKSLSPRSTASASGLLVSLRDWIVVCTTQKFHLLFVVLLKRDKKIIFFSFLVISFHFHDDDQNYTHTYEKRSNEISNVRTFGASVPGWGSSSRTSVVLWLVLRKKLRLLATRSSHAEKEEHEAALGSSLERNLARCFCFGFPSIFSIFCLSFPTRLEAQTMEIHLLHYWCISPLILASNLSLEFE